LHLIFKNHKRRAKTDVNSGPQERQTNRNGRGDMTESIFPQPKFLEPGPRAQEVSNLDSYWTTTLPEDLLKDQSIRLQLFYAVGVIL